MGAQSVRQKSIIFLLLVLLVLPLGHSKVEARGFTKGTVGVAVLIILGVYGSVNYLSRDSFTTYARKQVALSAYPLRISIVGISNYEEKRWIITHRNGSPYLKPAFTQLSSVERWWNNYGQFTNPESRIRLLMSHLDEDYRSWKNSTQSKAVTMSFVDYSSYIAANCEAINDSGQFIKAFHESDSDYMQSRPHCKRWLNDNFQWSDYFASHRSQNLSVVLIPKWDANMSVGAVPPLVSYLFNAN